MSAHYSLMVDLETLGTAANAVITQIGAIVFDSCTGERMAEFVCEVSVADQLERGRSISADTLRWYQQQQLEVAGLSAHTATLQEALRQFFCWVKRQVNTAEELEVWSKGMDFDMAILQDAFTHCGLSCPWFYYMQRDLRTVVSQAQKQGLELEPRMASHDALEDCREQLRVLREVMLWNCLQPEDCWAGSQAREEAGC